MTRIFFQKRAFSQTFSLLTPKKKLHSSLSDSNPLKFHNPFNPENAHLFGKEKRLDRQQLDFGKEREKLARGSNALQASPPSIRKLGEFRLSPVGFCSMGLSIDGKPSEMDALRTIKASLDHGTNLLEGASFYGVGKRDHGNNERLLSMALREWEGDAESVLLAIKGGMERAGSRVTPNASPANLRKSVEESLEALNAKCLDMFLLYANDQKNPFSESVREVRKLQKEGMVKHLGLWDASLERIIEAREMIDVDAVENSLSIFDASSIDNGIIDYCQRGGILFFASSPFGGDQKSAQLDEMGLVLQLAKKYQCTIYQLVLAYLTNLSSVVIPLPGSKNSTRATENAGAAKFSLSAEDIKLLYLLSQKL